MSAPLIAVIGGSSCARGARQAGGLTVLGLHDSFTPAVDIPRVERAEQAVQWALEQARRREV